MASACFALPPPACAHETPYFHGTSLEGLHRIMADQSVLPSVDGHVHSFPSQDLVAEKEYSVFQYIGNGLLVRSCVVVFGDFRAKKQSTGPQMRAATVRIAGYVVEVISARILAELHDVRHVSVAV